MKNTKSLLTRIENGQLWGYFHKDWLLQIRHVLRPQLPPEYYVFVESETILVTPPPGSLKASVMPDVAIVRSEPKGPPSGKAGTATTAIVEVEESVELLSRYTLLIRRAPENRLIAAVEILSPTNKGIFGALEMDKYLRKRGQYLEAGVNVLEIDALLGGQRLLPAVLNTLSKYARNAWAVFHDNGRRRWRGWGWDPDFELPVIPWDVESGLQVIVDLPVALRQACEFNRWEDLVAQSGKQEKG